MTIQKIKSGNAYKNTTSVVSANTCGVFSSLPSSDTGIQVPYVYAGPDNPVTWTAVNTLTNNTPATLKVAGGYGVRQHIQTIEVSNAGVAVDLIILDNVTEIWRVTLPATSVSSFTISGGLKSSPNTALNVNLSGSVTVRVNTQGYTQSS